MRNERHVVPDHGAWAVKQAGNGRFDSRHTTQREAIERAREILSTSGGGEVLVHGSDGRLRDSDTVFARTRETAER